MTDKLWITWTLRDRDEVATNLVDRCPTLSAKRATIEQCESLFLNCDYYITKQLRHSGPIDEIKVECFAGEDIHKLLVSLWTLHNLTGRKITTEANGVIVTLEGKAP